METGPGVGRTQAAKSPAEFARELRFRRSLREASCLPSIPPTLLSLDSEPKIGAIDSAPVSSGRLHLWSPLERWPETLREIYRQDILAAFPSQRKRPSPGLEEVVLCLSVRRCPRKGFRLEERNCLFYCRGICSLATLQRRSDEASPSLSQTSIGYYLGVARQRASLLAGRAQDFLKKQLRRKRGFGELCPAAESDAEAAPESGPSSNDR